MIKLEENEYNISPGKHKRYLKRLRKVNTKGMGCPWQGDRVIFRLEICFENRLGEQANFSLHFVTVRKIKGKELKKYRDYFAKTGNCLGEGETIELLHLLSYLDSYYQQIKQKNKVNNCFIYPAGKVGENKIRYPLARRVWDENFEEFPLHQDLLALYRNTIYHQQETKNNQYKKIDLAITN